MKIQVLGMGCASCKRLYLRPREVIKAMGLNVDVEYIDDMQKIVDMGLMSSPVLAIDGKPVIAGYIPDEKEIREAILSGKAGRKGDRACDCGGNC